MKVALDIAAWRGLETTERVWGVPTTEAPAQVKFALPGRTDIIVANVVDGGTKIEIFPERSGAHNALRNALGA